MTSASLDRLLAVLVVALAATGLLSLRAGHPADGWIFAVHGILAGALVVAIVMKVRRSVPRAIDRGRWGRLGLGLLVTLGAAAALSGGYLWVASGEILWLDMAGLIRWTVLTLHAWIGLATVPLVVIHLLPARWRLLKPGRRTAGRTAGRLLTRRSVAIGGLLLLAGLTLRTAADLVERALGGERRFTGSRWLPAGGIPPPTTFFGEPPPAIDGAAWRVSVGGRVGRPGEWTIDALRALGETDLTAILDCTSGWAIETGWRGVPLGALLDAAGAAPDLRAVLVRSATGWSTELPAADARTALLAIDVAGQPLPIANGAPLRLVAPDRRGLDWIKWITEIEAR